MSDTRFTIIGIILIFVGFIILGIFGEVFLVSSIEAAEFGNCFEYFDDKAPEPVECEAKLYEKSMFFGLVIGLIIAGILTLIKAVKGKWDQDVKPQDMVGPGGPTKPDLD